MSGKKWTLSFLSIIIGVLVVIAGLNYFVDPFGYFRFRGGDYYELGEDYYTRYLKAQHINNFPEEYDGYVLGGSKAGGLLTETLSNVEGLDYYSCWQLLGNFREYELYGNFILEHTNAKKILLHLSSFEINCFDREYRGDMYVTPAIISGRSEAAETVEFLFKNAKTALTHLWDTRVEGNVEDPYPDMETGERNLEKYYTQFAQDPTKYINAHVLDDFNKNLKRLFKKKKDLDAYQDNLQALKNLKKACEKKGVELQVVIGSTFVGELYRYEGEEYWDYLRDLVQITDVWDFSGYNDVNFNPYNFYNELHYNYEVGNLIIKTINGKESRQGFGVYLTNDNIYEYLQKRRQTYYSLKEEYEQTGTIALGAYEDDSRIQ